LLAETEGAGIIYAGTRANAEEVAIFAREVMGLPAEHYHAGLDALAAAIRGAPDAPPTSTPRQGTPC